MTRGGRNEPDFAQAALAHLDSLYGYGMSLSHNPAEAEDLVQETYLRATKAFGNLAPDSNLKNWLCTILRNVWRNRIREIGRGPQFVGGYDELEIHAVPGARSTDDPYRSRVTGEERDDVRAAVRNLPQPYREVIVLREFEGLSYREIAGILNCPAGTVMSRLGRARDKLRSMLSQWSVIPMQPPIEGNNEPLY